MDEVKVTIIGAGVVGLAMAAELALDGHAVLVLERHETFGRETSSRNSEVIHAGIYYPPDSLKAALCVEGAELLYRYCAEHGIPHSRIGKLIVATESSEIDTLEALEKKGLRNGVQGLRLIGGSEARALEPKARAVAALYSPNTGLVDSHRLMATLHGAAESRGATFAFNSEVDFVEKTAGGYVIGVKGDAYRLQSKVVINSAGLSADRVASLIGIDPDAAGCRIRYCKGSYFAYQKRSPVSRLVYPVPHEDLAGLGVHATLDLAGSLRFGPDTEYVDGIDYEVDAGKASFFYESASRIIEGLEREAVVPGMAGVRPKLAGEGVMDFVLRHEAERGLEGIVNLVGIESPGLTACLALARRVRAMLKDVL